MSTTIESDPRVSAGAIPSGLRCCLRPKEHLGRQGPIAHMGELELVNHSSEVLEIEHQMSPLQHLELVVTDSAGQVVSEGRYSDRLSPSLNPPCLRLLPGENYVATVPLLATFPRERRRSGAYSVQAIFDYRGQRAISEPVSVELGTEAL
jgi:hypothetical protein